MNDTRSKYDIHIDMDAFLLLSEPMEQHRSGLHGDKILYWWDLLAIPEMTLIDRF